MFSGNDQISGRQLYRNYTVGLVSLSALLIPAGMRRETGGSILTALVMVGFFLALSVRVSAPTGRWLRAVSYLHYWVLGTMTARMTGMLIREFLLTGTSLWLILVWFYLFCFYNLYKGLECRARVSEILFPFFTFLLLLLSLLMLGEVELSRLRELRISLHVEDLEGGYRLFCWLGAVQGLWYLQGCVRPASSGRKAAGAVWLTGAAAAILWGLFTFGIYGDAGHTGLVFPLASAMTLAHFPGDVIGRLDTLFVFAWVIGLFLLCSSLFAPLQSEEPDRKGKYLLAALLAASFALTIQKNCMEWCQTALYYVTMPLQLLLLLWQSLPKKKQGRRLTGIMLFLLSALLLTGCGHQELEQRSLVTAIGVDVGKQADFQLTFGFGSAGEEGEEPFETEACSLKEAEEIYYASSRKNMDFNHLKNFYFSEEVLRSVHLAELLAELQTEGTYSRGISVYGTMGPAAEMAEQEEQAEEGMPIHRLLNAWYNGEICEIPAVTQEHLYKGTISWPY